MTTASYSLLQRWRRKARWWAGRGWSAEDFAERYAKGAGDAWGYRESPQHRRRADRIMAALPKPHFATALEVGCAQGFLTERLATRAERVIACDISAEAVRQARENCREFPNVEFHVADIRQGFPGDGFEIGLFSDVLYYLSVAETDGVLALAAQKITLGGFLVIANEWSDGAKGLTHPSYVFARLDAGERWERVSALQENLGETNLMLAVYRLRPPAVGRNVHVGTASELG